MVDSTHHEVGQLMTEAGAIGEVTIGVRRKMPRPPSKPQSGPKEIVIHRPNLSTSFGFVLQSNTLRTGCMICECLYTFFVKIYSSIQNLLLLHVSNCNMMCS